MEIHEIKGYISVLYLVEDTKGLLLLDSGCSVDAKAVKSFIEEKLNRPITDLRLVLVTHAHPDHSGGASFFQKMGIPIAGNELSNLWYAGPTGLITWIVDIFLTFVVASKIRKSKVYQNVLFPRKINFDFKLNDGDKLPIFLDWEVLSTPGHTASDISLFHSKTKTAYIADNLISTRQGIIKPYPLTYPLLYKDTLQLYLNKGVETFLMAHYGKSRIEKDVIEKIIKSLSFTPRRHRTTLFKIIRGVFFKK